MRAWRAFVCTSRLFKLKMSICISDYPAIEACLACFDEAVAVRRKDLEREMEKLRKIELFAHKAFECMNSPPIPIETSLWAAICHENLPAFREIEEWIYAQELDDRFEKVDDALSTTIYPRMAKEPKDVDEGDVDDNSFPEDFSLIEALAANIRATSSAQEKLRQMGKKYEARLAAEKAHGKRKRVCGESALDFELDLAHRLMELLLESPEFARLFAHVQQHEHLLPKLS